MHSEGLHNLYSSPNTIWVIKPRRMRWAGHAAYVEREEVHTGFWWGNLSEEGQMEDLHTDGRIILKCILKK